MPSQNVRLRRKEAAAALTAAGFPIAPSSLATMVCKGGGPPFEKWGNIPLYRLSDLLEWAESRVARTRKTPAEAQ